MSQESQTSYRKLVANGSCVSSTRRFDPHQKITISAGDAVEFFAGNEGKQTVCRKNIRYEFFKRFAPELLEFDNEE